MPVYANKVTNFSAYGKIGDKLTMLRDVLNYQLPSIENATDTMKGGGIIGEIDLPNLANPGSMTATVTFKVDSPEAAKMNAQKVAEMEFRWLTDKLNSTTSTVSQTQHKAVLKGLPKKYDPGKVESGSAQEGSNEYEIFYYKKIVDGVVLLEIDKLNSVYIVNGVDYAAAIRNAL
jgi:P2 family phage contractile tail tube protein